MEHYDKYIATYKCLQCGQLLVFGEPHEVPEWKLSELCGRIVADQQFIGNPHLYKAPMQLVHTCGDGNCGMAYFAGFRKC